MKSHLLRDEASTCAQSWVGLVVFFAGIFAVPVGAVTISDADHEGRAQFKIETAGATYFFDCAGGGFSRLIDRDGRDWISFKKDPLTGTRAAAGAGYRGIPNMVFGDGNPALALAIRGTTSARAGSSPPTQFAP